MIKPARRRQTVSYMLLKVVRCLILGCAPEGGGEKTPVLSKLCIAHDWRHTVDKKQIGFNMQIRYQDFINRSRALVFLIFDLQFYLTLYSEFFLSAFYVLGLYRLCCTLKS